MSLYELSSTFQALGKMGKVPPLSQEAALATRDRMAELFQNDPSVRLH